LDVSWNLRWASNETDKLPVQNTYGFTVQSHEELLKSS